MKPRVLKTGCDYKAALAHVEQLMGQPSPDEDELELWSLLVEKYEEERFPIATPDPIEAIRFRMDRPACNPPDSNYLKAKARSRR